MRSAESRAEPRAFAAAYHADQQYGEQPIRRPMQAPPVKDGPRMNQDIRVPRVLLIDQNGEKQGIMPIDAAIEAAEEAGLDLVEIVPTADPPVCKILDYGKFRFQEQKKKAEARKRQKVVEIKEIKLRPNIDDHDYDTKAKAMHRFFDEGDKVKITLRFRGREMAHPELGMKLLQKVRADFEPVAKVEYEPRMEGRQMIMILAPR
jgi:translation initiation factor IF-3